MSYDHKAVIPISSTSPTGSYPQAFGGIIKAKPPEHLSNQQIAQTFQTIADLLEIKGEVIYTILAYCKASESLENLGREVYGIWQEGRLNILELLSVSGEDSTFIMQVIAKYMDGFPNYLKRASGRYFSIVGFPPDISLQPTDWSAEVHKAYHSDR